MEKILDWNMEKLRNIYETFVEKTDMENEKTNTLENYRLEKPKTR